MSRRSFPFSVALVATVAVLGLAGAAAAGSYPQDRHGFMMGANLGGGTAAVSASSGGTSVSSDREGGVAGNFRLGWGLNPHLSLGLESNAWSKSENGATVSFAVSALTATFYPNPAQGFYVRAGVGGSSQSLRIDQGGGFFGEATETGFGFTGGTGYEMRLGRHWSLGPALDYGYSTVDVNGGSLSANYVNFSAAFNWYFQ